MWYPYQMVQQTCHSTTKGEQGTPLVAYGPVNAIVTPGTKCIPGQSCAATDAVADGHLRIKAALEKYGPLSIVIDASAWQPYVGGIFPNTECGGIVDHAVQVRDTLVVDISVRPSVLTQSGIVLCDLLSSLLSARRLWFRNSEWSCYTVLPRSQFVSVTSRVTVEIVSETQLDMLILLFVASCCIPFASRHDSWGEDWGEGGFIRLDASTSACSIAYEPYYATF